MFSNVLDRKRRAPNLSVCKVTECDVESRHNVVFRDCTRTQVMAPKDE